MDLTGPPLSLELSVSHVIFFWRTEESYRNFLLLISTINLTLLNDSLQSFVFLSSVHYAWGKEGYWIQLDFTLCKGFRRILILFINVFMKFKVVRKNSCANGAKTLKYKIKMKIKTRAYVIWNRRPFTPREVFHRSTIYYIDHNFTFLAIELA